MDWLMDPQIWVALLTLTVLEIVLGIDNIIFISIISGKLEPSKQDTARRVGLALAVVTRLALLYSVVWLTELTAPLFSVLDHEISVRDLILLGGGLFLLAKSTFEIHSSLEGHESQKEGKNRPTMTSAIVQILILDVIFSLDSVITAIGMADDFRVMVAAVVIAVAFMLWWAKAVSDFVHRHPTVKVLALSFLLLIGFALIGEGMGLHIPKGYIYFAMGFSFFVEMLNMKLRSDSPASPPS